MTLSIASALQTHLDGEVTTLCTLWTVTRTDGVVLRLTDHDKDVVYSGDTYTSGVGFNASAIEDKSDLSVDNLDLQGIITGEEITRENIRAGLFDFAQIEIGVINYESPSDGYILRRKGWLGEVNLNSAGAFTAELRGLTQALTEQTIGVYTPACRVDLGSTPCGIPIDPGVRQNSTAYAVGDYVKVATSTASPAPTTQEQYENRIYRCVSAGTTDSSAPTFETDPDASPNTTTDGTVTWEAVQAWTRHAEVAAVTDRRVFTVTVDETRAANTTWFAGGVATFETGSNAGISREIKAWDGAGSPAANSVTLFLPMPFTISAGDKLKVVPGCDKRRSTCRDKFANAVNHRGFPDLPGEDWLIKYPK